jgi:hypothetical protein
MLQVEYLHLCDYAFTAEGGKPGIIGIFDNVSAPTFPMKQPYMAVAMQLRGESNRLVPITTELKGPSGQAVGSLESKVQTGNDGGKFFVLNLINITFPAAGTYTLTVSSLGTALAMTSLTLVHIPRPTPPTTQ